MMNVNQFGTSEAVPNMITWGEATEGSFYEFQTEP